MFEKNKLKKHTAFLDILRVFSCIAIITLHINQNSFLDSTTASDEIISFIHLFQNYFQWAVPMFLMISGYIFLGVKDECTYKSMKKQYIKILLIIILFFTAFNLIELFVKSNGFYINIFIDAIYLTLQGKSWDHMWFIMTIFIAYLIFPLVRPFYDKGGRDLDVFIFLYTIFIIIIPEINRMLNLNIYSYFIFDYKIYYCFLGGYLYKKKIVNTPLSNIIMILFLILLFVLNAFCFMSPKIHMSLSSNNQRVVTLIEAFLIFNIFANLFNIESNTFSFLSKYTLYVYIFHVGFVHILTKVLKIFPYELKYSYVMVPLAVSGVFVSSLIVSVIVKPIFEIINNKINNLLIREE